ncbi:O-methyltransferase [Acidovorax delafieldii]|uniref:O-methyltransferase n=1 Tax=Acidovorax delafieldii TaxID=47920 RepID=UPI00375840A6
MDGSSIPYQLRINKAVDRILFIELLHRINRVSNISDYSYVGFGGPYMEDFKQVHLALGIKKMVCLEMDPAVMQRQIFNYRSRHLQYVNASSTEYLKNFDPRGGHILWLDYAIPSQLGQQLMDIRKAIGVLKPLDILKVTLNANPTCISYERPDTVKKSEEIKIMQEGRLKTFEEMTSPYAPNNLSKKDIEGNTYYKTLFSTFRNCISSVPLSADQYFQILSAFHYKDDGHRMLTITGVILHKSEFRSFLKKTRIGHWRYHNLSQFDPIEINLPNLTAMERQRLDECMPLDTSPVSKYTERRVAKTLEKALGFSIVRSKKENEALFYNYAKYYRISPLFSRISL